LAKKISRRELFPPPAPACMPLKVAKILFFVEPAFDFSERCEARLSNSHFHHDGKIELPLIFSGITILLILCNIVPEDAV